LDEEFEEEIESSLRSKPILEDELQFEDEFEENFEIIPASKKIIIDSKEQLSNSSFIKFL
jgi:hypothetical protein